MATGHCRRAARRWQSSQVSGGLGFVAPPWGARVSGGLGFVAPPRALR
ncbi:MAG TPA: hypothetical protein VL242_45590 [Sorangium sp.]|nr:hypothetical protein [Sorangium sp.]